MPEPPLVRFETLGCRLNQDETEGAAFCFSRAGFATELEGVSSSTPRDESAVLCVINTCTVTSKAEQKARRIIRLLLEKFPSAPVLATGCYAELDADEIRGISPRICVLPGKRKQLLARIPQFAKSALEKGALSAETLQEFIDSNFLEAPAPFELFAPVFKKHSRPSIKIQDGCSGSCAFCRIRIARGKPISLEPEEVLRRISALEEGGAAEAVLSGVNLSQYAGKNSGGKTLSFAELLDFLLSGTRRIRLRISSLYPQHVTPRLCEAVRSERIQPFFHLSAQSGSDRILSLMRRPYTSADVFSAARLLREAKDSPFISCDMIAGFPGETEEDFRLTEEMCEKINFAWIHPFPFSPRPGTEAHGMRPQVPEREKGERVKRLSELAQRGKIDFVNSCAGKTFSATVENSRAKRLSAAGPRTFHCVTENFLHAEFDSERIIPAGSMVRVEIKSALEGSIRSGGELDCGAVLRN